MKDDSKMLVSVVIPTHNRKKKLERLINSINNGSFKNIEIIVVDDASTDGTYEEIKKRFPYVNILRNSNPKLVSSCRNIGLNHSRGEFIFFIDDDNVIERECIRNLVDAFKTPNIGIAAPIMYYYRYPTMVWCAGVKRNLVSSRTKAIAKGSIDVGQFNVATESDDFPNAFMVRRKVVSTGKIKFDEKNFPWFYEESDFCYKVRNNGWKIALIPKAKLWHDVPIEFFFMGNYSSIKTYYLARNRIIFHKKFSKKNQYLVFRFVFLPLFTYSYIVFLGLQQWLSKGNLLSIIPISKAYIKGISDGIIISRGIRP
jgi:glycosyltransferase involved in cell wall biosynthesis